uniref:DDE-type integrase/transposase/recombinase n=1 Tax=Actinomadura sp. CA-154981 TaxID=3240037 RepID=UPI003F49A6AA
MPPTGGGKECPPATGFTGRSGSASAGHRCFSRRIIGHSIDIRQSTKLVVDAMAAAVARRKPAKDATILHSDHGTQFTSWTFGKRHRDAGLLGSMGKVGDCYGNAVIESFWG